MDHTIAAPTRPKGSIDALVRFASSDMTEVDALLVKCMQSQVPVIPRWVDHLMSAGDKGLRPLLTVAADPGDWGEGGDPRVDQACCSRRAQVMGQLRDTRRAIFYTPFGVTASLLASLDTWLGRRTTLGAAFVALGAIKS